MSDFVLTYWYRPSDATEYVQVRHDFQADTINAAKAEANARIAASRMWVYNANLQLKDNSAPYQKCDARKPRKNTTAWKQKRFWSEA